MEKKKKGSFAAQLVQLRTDMQAKGVLAPSPAPKTGGSRTERRANISPFVGQPYVAHVSYPAKGDESYEAVGRDRRGHGRHPSCAAIDEADGDRDFFVAEIPKAYHYESIGDSLDPLVEYVGRFGFRFAIRAEGLAFMKEHVETVPRVYVFGSFGRDDDDDDGEYDPSLRRMTRDGILELRNTAEYLRLPFHREVDYSYEENRAMFRRKVHVVHVSMDYVPRGKMLLVKK